jgi:hypothetical protein
MDEKTGSEYPKDYAGKYWKILRDRATNEIKKEFDTKGGFIKLSWNVGITAIFIFTFSSFVGISISSRLLSGVENSSRIRLVVFAVVSLFLGGFLEVLYLRYIIVPITAFFRKFDLAAKKDFEKEQLIEKKQLEIDGLNKKLDNSPKYMNLDIFCYPITDNKNRVGIQVYNLPDNEPIENIAVSLLEIEKQENDKRPTPLEIPVYKRNFASIDGDNKEGKLFPDRSIFVHIAELKDEKLFILLDDTYEVQKYDTHLFDPIEKDKPFNESSHGEYNIRLRIDGTIKNNFDENRDRAITPFIFSGNIRFSKNKINWIVDESQKIVKNENPTRVTIFMNGEVEKSAWQSW